MKRVNLFFIQNNEIAVLRLKNINKSEQQLEFLKKEGEKFQAINSDFWAWWEEKVGFSNGDEMDFCFVWDEKNDLIMQNERFCNNLESDIWNEETLDLLLGLFDIKGKISSPNGNFIGFEQYEKEFHTNLILKNQLPPKSRANNSSKKQFNQGTIAPTTQDETPMQKYFREMREREDRQRRK